MKLTSSPSFSSPEERAMHMKLLAKFNLNPFPFENIEEEQQEGEGSIYPKFEQRENKFQKDFEDEDEMFNLFSPFVENEAFQISDRGGSSGPILSLMSQSKKTSN